jgi:hypothetical protein
VDLEQERRDEPGQPAAQVGRGADAREQADADIQEKDEQELL